MSATAYGYAGDFDDGDDDSIGHMGEMFQPAAPAVFGRGMMPGSAASHAAARAQVPGAPAAFALMGAMGSIYGGMGALTYSPPQATGSGSSYNPGDTAQDALALNYLGYFPDQLVASHVGTSGSVSADQANSTGAWDPDFQTAVRDFQAATGLSVDGWIGNQTRAKLLAMVNAKNAAGGVVVPPLVNPSGGGGAISPVSHTTGFTTAEKVIGGVVALGLAFGLYKALT